MDIWTQLLGGFATAATPINLLWAFVGCVVGTGDRRAARPRARR